MIFQDDIIRFEKSENQLNTANIIFEIFQNINKMEFHPIKTKAMIINGNTEKVVQIVIVDSVTARLSLNVKYFSRTLIP